MSRLRSIFDESNSSVVLKKWHSMDELPSISFCDAISLPTPMNLSILRFSMQSSTVRYRVEGLSPVCFMSASISVRLRSGIVLQRRSMKSSAISSDAVSEL